MLVLLSTLYFVFVYLRICVGGNCLTICKIRSEKVNKEMVSGDVVNIMRTKFHNWPKNITFGIWIVLYFPFQRRGAE